MQKLRGDKANAGSQYSWVETAISGVWTRLQEKSAAEGAPIAATRPPKTCSQCSAVNSHFGALETPMKSPKAEGCRGLQVRNQTTQCSKRGAHANDVGSVWTERQSNYTEASGCTRSVSKTTA